MLAFITACTTVQAVRTYRVGYIGEQRRSTRTWPSQERPKMRLMSNLYAEQVRHRVRTDIRRILLPRILLYSAKHNVQRLLQRGMLWHTCLSVTSRL